MHALQRDKSNLLKETSLNATSYYGIFLHGPTDLKDVTTVEML